MQDRILRLSRLAPGSVLRAREVVVAPGGKPVNVARAALALGGRPVLLANCPGTSGARLADELSGSGLPVVRVPSAGELRAATMLLEDDGRTTVVNEAGPAVTPAVVDAFLAAYGEALGEHRPGLVVASGSLPPGAPDDLYAELVGIGREHGADTVVDAAGAVLAAALAAGPALVKPNLAEAESLLGSGEAVESVDESGADVPERCVAAAAALVSAGARAALVSGGRLGAGLHGEGGSWWFAAPQVETVNPVGAGDALVAGVAVAWERGDPLPVAVRYGVACGADSVRRIGPASVDPAGAVALVAEVQTTGAAVPP